MASISVVNISPTETNTYNIKPAPLQDYAYSSRWYYQEFKEFLPIIYSLQISKNFSVPTDQLLSSQASIIENTQKHHLLPLSVRYLDDHGTYYIERPPFKAKISYKNARAAYSGKVVDDLEIWVPWTLMVIPSSFHLNFDPTNILLLYSYKPLEDLRDTYVHSFLPNSYAHGGICWSSSFQKLISLDETKNTINSFDATYWHSMIINDYMMGGWNNDLASKNAINLFQHSETSNYIRDSIFPDDSALFEKYPMLHRYIHMEQYSELFSIVNGILINKFDYSNEEAEYITNFNSLRKKPKRRRRTDSYSNNPEHGYSFAKFFSFMSTLTLAETLQFYSEYSSFVRRKTSHRDDYGYGSYISFSSLLKITKSENRYSYQELPMHLPVTHLTSNNISLFESSSSKFKNVTIYFILTNLTSVMKKSYYDKFYHDGYKNFFVDLVDRLKIDIRQFLEIIDNADQLAKNNKIYISIDAQTSQIAVHDKSYYVNIASEITTLVQEKINQSQSSSKGSTPRYIEHYLSGLITLDKVKDSLLIN